MIEALQMIETLGSLLGPKDTWSATGAQVGKHAPRQAGGVRFALCEVVRDAAGRAVQLRPAQILRAHVLACGRLGQQDIESASRNFLKSN